MEKKWRRFGSGGVLTCYPLFLYTMLWYIISGAYGLPGPQREILIGGTRLLWGPGDSLPGYNDNVSDDKQPELSEFYIIILNKLKIVETPMKK